MDVGGKGYYWIDCRNVEANPEARELEVCFSSSLLVQTVHLNNGVPSSSRLVQTIPAKRRLLFLMAC